MGIDSLKSGLSSLVSTVQQKVETALTPRPPPSLELNEGFSDPRARPMSITGKFVPLPSAQPASPSLADDVKSLRAMANAGAAAHALKVSTPSEKDGSVGALRAAIREKDDEKIRTQVNHDPALLSRLSPSEKGKALEVLRSGYTSEGDAAAMVRIVESCRTKGELRAVLKAASGGDVSQAAMHRYDKQMTAHHPYLIADLLNSANPTLGEREHRDALSAHEHVGDKGDYPKRDADEAFDLRDPAARRRFIETFTQVDAQHASGAAYQNGCAASCVIVAALQSGDGQALGKLIDHNVKTAKGHLPSVGEGAANAEALEALKGRLASGAPLTRADADLLQRTTYVSLQRAKSQTGGSDSELVNVGGVKQLLRESGIGLSGGVPTLVDTNRGLDGADSVGPEHWVLVNEANGEVYDPWPRRDGVQVVPPGSPALDEPARP